MSALQVMPHFSLDEVFERYRRCTDGTAKTHWQIIWLKAQGRPTGEIASVTGYRPDWVRRIVRRYNEQGPESLGDQRVHNGQEPILDAAQQQELFQALQGPAPDGGLWNSTKVAQWIEKRVGRPIRFQRGWEYLRRLRMTLQVPRPRHLEADEQAQQEFKKNWVGESNSSEKNIRGRAWRSGHKMKHAWG